MKPTFTTHQGLLRLLVFALGCGLIVWLIVATDVPVRCRDGTTPIRPELDSARLPCFVIEAYRTAFESPPTDCVSGRDRAVVKDGKGL